MNKNKDKIIIAKLIKYCYDSIKYIGDYTYEQFVEDEKTLVFAIFCLSQMGELTTKLSDDFMERNPNIPRKVI